MKRNSRARILASALAVGFAAAGCGGQAEQDQQQKGTQQRAGVGDRAGQGAGGTSNLGGKAYREVGDGEYAVLLSDAASAGSYCWFIEETVRISAGASKRTSYDDICIDDETNCLLQEPEGYKRETSSSYVRVSYRTVGNGPLPGSCAVMKAYWGDDPSVDCLFHKHCQGGQKCVDYLCSCPPGASCADPGDPSAPGASEPSGGGEPTDPAAPESTPSEDPQSPGPTPPA